MDIEDLLAVWMEKWDPNLSEEFQNKFRNNKFAQEIIDGLKGNWSKSMVVDAMQANKKLGDVHNSLTKKIHDLGSIPLKAPRTTMNEFEEIAALDRVIGEAQRTLDEIRADWKPVYCTFCGYEVGVYGVERCRCHE